MSILPGVEQTWGFLHLLTSLLTGDLAFRSLRGLQENVKTQATHIVDDTSSQIFPFACRNDKASSVEKEFHFAGTVYKRKHHHAPKLWNHFRATKGPSGLIKAWRHPESLKAQCLRREEKFGLEPWAWGPAQLDEQAQCSAENVQTQIMRFCTGCISASRHQGPIIEGFAG